MAEKLTYDEAVHWLVEELPMFQNTGQKAYHPGLDTSHKLDDAFGHPHKRFRTIHIAGTNGKGSVSHTLAAILQSHGYKVGLYTSPHLVDFRERIRVNGEKIIPDAVADFVNRYRKMNGMPQPSFFELTTIMAFDYFAACGVDFAVIETGLGGRLDTTNIVTPVLSVITNISLDHTGILGSTLEAIAAEKAGIIKSGVHVVIGEVLPQTRPVFDSAALANDAPLYYAQESGVISSYCADENVWRYDTADFGVISGELTGECQPLNAATILTAVKVLEKEGIAIDVSDVEHGFSSVVEMTGLMGRWTTLSQNPRVVCDTGHNPGAWVHIGKQLASIDGVVRLVLGFASDKDVDSILDVVASLDNVVKIYLTSPSVSRGLSVELLGEKAAAKGLAYELVDTVAAAYNKARTEAGSGDTIFVGGSGFVVADLLNVIGQR
ncbi:MAG: bifunctional folylpolyglutamate synthase/dihydrofolate synthase [Paramuribaculum sp.]|nr:bifunctional folylpolyglutamate synthase/dihydrofolate synthase [Paramuribaculum sp.]